MSAPEIKGVFTLAVEGVDQALKRSPATDVVCRSCPYDHTCCDSLVGITMIEAVILAGHIYGRPDKWQIIRQMKERYEIIKQAYQKISKVPNGNLTAEYFSRHVKCALYQDGRCSAYEVRPIPCREAYTAPGDSCHKTSSLVNTGAQDMLIEVAQKGGLDRTALGYNEMNTALLAIITGKPLTDYMVKALATQVKREAPNDVSTSYAGQ